MKASRLLEIDSRIFGKQDTSRSFGVGPSQRWFALMQRINQSKSEKEKLDLLKRARSSIVNRISLLRELEGTLSKEIVRISKKS